MHQAMDGSCSVVSSLMTKGSFASAPRGAEQTCCLLGRSLGYQGLQEIQIRAIHTGNFLSAFVRLVTSSGEAVTPVGSNIFPRERCQPFMCLSLQVWLPAPGNPVSPLAFGACNSIPGWSPQLVWPQQCSPGSHIWTRSQRNVAQQRTCAS